jgi:hypothetical protein
VLFNLFAEPRMFCARLKWRQFLDRRRLHDALRRFRRSPDKAAGFR